jgi:hypothetical protein
MGLEIVVSKYIRGCTIAVRLVAAGQVSGEKEKGGSREKGKVLCYSDCSRSC